MKHLNKLCALAHIQEILDVINTTIVDEEADDIVRDELMRECADLALVTNQQHEGQCPFSIDQLKYELQRITAKIRCARQIYLVGHLKVPSWLAKIERDVEIESSLKLAGAVADCFAKARADENGLKYTTLLNERSKKFKSIDLDYQITPEVHPTSTPTGHE